MPGWLLLIGTQAVKDPDFVRAASAEIPGKIIIGLDAVNGKVATEGWADVSELAVEEALQRFDGLGMTVIYTDIDRDGMMQGANVAATVALAERSSIPVIASGGIAKLADIVDLKAAAKPQAAPALSAPSPAARFTKVSWIYRRRRPTVIQTLTFR